jgi:hypothetical protein
VSKPTLSETKDVMSIAVGDVVIIRIIEVEQYACWGEVDGQICFTHVTDWSMERPVPERCYPKVGQKLKAKVFHIANDSDEPQPADITFDSKYHVDFAASFALLEGKNESVD